MPSLKRSVATIAATAAATVVACATPDFNTTADDTHTAVDDDASWADDDDTTSVDDDSTSTQDDSTDVDDDTFVVPLVPHMWWVPTYQWSNGQVDFHATPSGTLGSEPVASHVVPAGGDSCSPFWFLADWNADGDGSPVYYMLAFWFPAPATEGATSDLSAVVEGEDWQETFRPVTWWDEAAGLSYVWRGGWGTVTEYTDTRMVIHLTEGDVCEVPSTLNNNGASEYNCMPDELLLTLAAFYEPDGVDYLTIPQWVDAQVVEHDVSCQTDDIEGLGWCACTLDSVP